MSVKEKLIQICSEKLNSRISIAEKAMKSAQESANREEKSTAGDKHDTARAMSHIERDMYAKQLNESIILKKNLDSINLKHQPEVIALGSLVKTDVANYFIAIGLGKISYDEVDYLVISPLSPIGQLMIGSKRGDSFSFNKRNTSILEVL